jgi:putative NADH-flavin reductase
MLCTKKSTETFVETTRKLILATKASKSVYFIMIGGTGSLELPGHKFKTVADSREAWLAYRRGVADSEAATKHMEDRIGPGPMSDAMRAYRSARVAMKAGKAGDQEKKTIKEIEDVVKYGENWINELPLAARATFVMFEGNTTFDWTFVSPSGRYRPGPRTGKYEVSIDMLPLAKEANSKSEDGNEYEGRLLGVSAADLAVAVVDEAEKREKIGKHWSPTSEWDSDEPMPTIITIS